MAGSLTDYAEELALNMLFRNTGTMPSAIYLGLSTSLVDETSTLASITEEDDSGYARQTVTFAAPAQSGTGPAEVENDAQIEFGPWTVAADLPITHAFLCDAETGTSGNILAYFDLPSSKQPGAGESLLVTIGNCSFSLD